MRLTLEQIHWYLLDKGFLEPASLVSGDYIATQMQTRSTIFRITRRADKGLFIKQVGNIDTTNTYVLQKDATCLWLIKNHPAFERLSTYVPDYFGFDPEKQVLVTEYLPDASNLDDYARLHQGILPEALRAELASALASYHFPLSPDLLNSPSVQFFPQQAPWALNLGDPALTQQYVLSQAQAANPALSAVLGSPEFRAVLHELRQEWTATSLIHGDIKWMNLLVHPEEGQDKLKLIDWEIADLGDPLWDVAGVFQGFIVNALLYDPVLATGGAALVPALELHDLGTVWPLLEHFWLNYLVQMAPVGNLDEHALVKTLRYTAARLVQAAIEQNMHSPSLLPLAVKLMQVSYAMLTKLPTLLGSFPAVQPAVLA